VVDADVVSATVVVEELSAASSNEGQVIAPPSQPTRASSVGARQELSPRPAVYTQRGVVDVAAIASIVLGGASLLLGVFYSGAVLLGMLGLAAGIAGFRSRWRQMAVIGLLVSLMGIAGSSTRLAYDAFAWWNGQSLLAPATTPESDSQLPDSLE
jgi:hypothetical protein